MVLVLELELFCLRAIIHVVTLSRPFCYTQMNGDWYLCANEPSAVGIIILTNQNSIQDSAVFLVLG